MWSYFPTILGFMMVKHSKTFISNAQIKPSLLIYCKNTKMQQSTKEIDRVFNRCYVPPHLQFNAAIIHSFKALQLNNAVQ